METFDKYLFIGGPIDGSRRTIRTNDDSPLPFVYVADIPRYQPSIDAEPQATHETFDTHVYRREALYVGERRYWVYLHDALPPQDVITQLIGGYGISVETKQKVNKMLTAAV